ncbi:IclR family transcriptional regulator domain-containing protein [Streptomyces prasinus]
MPSQEATGHDECPKRRDRLPSLPPNRSRPEDVRAGKARTARAAAPTRRGERPPRPETRSRRGRPRRASGGRRSRRTWRPGADAGTRLPRAAPLLPVRATGDLVRHRLPDRTAHGYRLFEPGLRAAAERTLLELAMPFLQDLYERTHETVHLGVREGHEIVYIAKIGGHRQARAPSRTGGRMPLHSDPRLP